MKGIERITSALVRHTQLTARYPKVSQRTTVVLLGWATARDENLAKYSEIYEKEGLSTLRFTSPFTGHKRSLKQAVRMLLNIRLSNFTPYHFLLDHPQLPRYLSFIYSDKDPICPPRTIQEFHEAVKRDDRKVDVLRLTESDHVEHFRKHPKEYYAILSHGTYCGGENRSPKLLSLFESRAAPTYNGSYPGTPTTTPIPLPSRSRNVE
ncbi:hypothetical protein NECAME_05264 [Necator americanus]|uniref:Uncharacterized protein n=1 Tax=Necator americanus TaxID=51031 RepID=W2SID0_NECAM|nr:hypothetical protein NECAME_05264 [Necator americanus]ETN69409.1 hypothetical protein NECAME_05264 [Necator americanus]